MNEDEILSAIECALRTPSSRAFAPFLERLYQQREGPGRRLRLAYALRVAAIGILAAFALDFANGGLPYLGLAMACRLGAAAFCLVSARIIVRTRRTWQEMLAYTFPVLAIILLTELLGQLSLARFGDRYMIAAAVIGLAMLAVPPVGLATGRSVAVIGALLFPVVPLACPGQLPLAENRDLLVFACGMLALGLSIVRRNVFRARVDFLQKLRHERFTAQLAQLNDELLRMSSTDWLTNLPNRRCFDQDLRALSQDSRKPGLGLALIDVDQFKAFNDTAGHDAGDACLRDIARLLSGALRGEERVARYGGEEFAALIPCEQHGLADVGERLRLAVEQAAMPHPGNGGAPVTISVGLAWCSSDPGGQAPRLVRRADDALYQAKRGGRNRTVMASNEDEDDGHKGKSAQAVDLPSNRLAAANIDR